MYVLCGEIKCILEAGRPSVSDLFGQQYSAENSLEIQIQKKKIYKASGGK